MENKYNEISPLVVQWAKERDLFKKPNPSKQLLKTLEEINELLVAVEDKKVDEIKDALGDIAVTLIIYAEMKDIKLEKLEKYPLSDYKAEKLINETLYHIINHWNELYSVEKHYNEGHTSKKFLIYDLVAYLSIVGNHFGLNLWDCLESAYNEIKDRKGKTVNGTFIKEK